MLPLAADERDHILERDREWAEISALLARTASGSGGALVVEGPAGIGKTSLLKVLRSAAGRNGFLVGRASGGSLEQEYSFGAVRQLFEPLVATASDPDLLFVGGAAAAAPLCGRRPPADAHVDHAPGEMLHGLYWLCVGLAELGRPLVLIADDAHWLDGPSLRFLAYLANRIGELPIALVIGTRPPHPGPDGDLLLRLITQQDVRHVRLQPLSDHGVTELMRTSLDEAPADSFCAAVSRASGGNPFLVGELVRATRSAGLAPESANADRLIEITVNSSVMARLGRLPHDALELARAVAVLGSEAHLRHAAAMAGISIDVAGAAADVLLRAEILGPERPLSFVHPLVASAVYNDLLPGDRSARHRRAAEVLVAEHAPADRMARHYIASEPAGDRAVVEVLAASAASAMAQGATDVAIAQLRRALVEPPPPDMRLRVVLSLGAAESFLLDPGAIEHLGEAIESIPDIRTRVMLTTARAVAMCIDGRPAEAVACLAALEAEVGDQHDDLRLELLAGANFVGATGPNAAPLVTDKIDELRTLVSVATDTSPGVLGVRAYVAACAGEPADDVAAWATRSLSSVSDTDPMLPIWFHLPLAALVMADRDEDAAAIIEERLTSVRRLGAPGQVSIALFLRSMIAFRAGDLDDAEADATAALGLCVDHGNAFVLPGPLAVLVEVLRERDELARAEALLAEHDYSRGDGDSVFDLFLLVARARLRGAEERWDESFADLERGWARSIDSACPSPGLVPWRANIAFGTMLAGRLGDAGSIARAALDEAERFGSERCRAEAQRAVAMAEPKVGAPLARQAADAFAKLGARIEEARTHFVIALCDGVVGTPREIESLSTGLQLAERCGATRLVAIARAKLRNLGSRPQLRPVSGLGALTASERRVAALAALGRANKEIAQELFVTVKTVETHLAHTFQKLGISSRNDLPPAISA